MDRITSPGLPPSLATSWALDPTRVSPVAHAVRDAHLANALVPLTSLTPTSYLTSGYTLSDFGSFATCADMMEPTALLVLPMMRLGFVHALASPMRVWRCVRQPWFPLAVFLRSAKECFSVRLAIGGVDVGMFLVSLAVYTVTGPCYRLSPHASGLRMQVWYGSGAQLYGPGADAPRVVCSPPPSSSWEPWHTDWVASTTDR